MHTPFTHTRTHLTRTHTPTHTQGNFVGRYLALSGLCGVWRESNTCIKSRSPQRMRVPYTMRDKSPTGMRGSSYWPRLISPTTLFHKTAWDQPTIFASSYSKVCPLCTLCVLSVGDLCSQSCAVAPALVLLKVCLNHVVRLSRIFCIQL
jgi:hypothetical protein